MCSKDIYTCSESYHSKQFFFKRLQKTVPKLRCVSFVHLFLAFSPHAHHLHDCQHIAWMCQILTFIHFTNNSLFPLSPVFSLVLFLDCNLYYFTCTDPLSSPKHYRKRQRYSQFPFSPVLCASAFCLNFI